MRFYLDQMFSPSLGAVLQAQGHDVSRTEETGQARSDDADILARACEQNRVLITLDDHFGDWAVLPLSHHPGVIRVKTHPTTTRNVAALLLPFVTSRDEDELRNHLVILSRKGVRWIRTAGD